MRQQVVREQHGLSVLHVGAARHGDVEVLRGLGHERVHDVEDQAGDDPRLVPQVAAEERDHLVVA